MRNGNVVTTRVDIKALGNGEAVYRSPATGVIVVIPVKLFGPDVDIPRSLHIQVELVS